MSKGLKLDKSLARLPTPTIRMIAQGRYQSNRGKLHDGGGLYILLRRGSASWAFKYQVMRRVRMMGLGSVAHVSAFEARERAREYRAMIRRGEDPLAERTRQRRLRWSNEHGSNVTFRAFAEQTLADWETTSERAAKTKASWRRVLNTHAYPTIGSKLLDDISEADIIDLLRPLWGPRRDAAQKTRVQIERVFDEARLRKLIDRPNPARYADLKASLAPFAKSRPKKHHAAMSWRLVPALMAKLAASPNLSAAALRLTILAATRTRETLGGRFNEIEHGVWSIPAERMKMKRPHRVPISTGLASVIDELRKRANGGQLMVPLSPMAMSMLLKNMGIKDTVHGFRSSFRDWAAEHGYPREFAEAALAHVAGGVEGAYFRSDLLEQRRAMMQAWSDHCLGEAREQKKLPAVDKPGGLKF